MRTPLIILGILLIATGLTLLVVPIRGWEITEYPAFASYVPVPIQLGSLPWVILCFGIGITVSPFLLRGWVIPVYVLLAASILLPATLQTAIRPRRYHYYYYSPESNWARGTVNILRLSLTGSAIAIAAMGVWKKRSNDLRPNEPT